MPEPTTPTKPADTASHPAAKSADEPKTAPAPKKGSLGNAGESTDPAVQFAVAQLNTARSNRDALDVPEPAVKEADAAVKAAEKTLADLGYEA